MISRGNLVSNVGITTGAGVGGVTVSGAGGLSDHGLVSMLGDGGDRGSPAGEGVAGLGAGVGVQRSADAVDNPLDVHGAGVDGLTSLDNQVDVSAAVKLHNVYGGGGDVFSIAGQVVGGVGILIGLCDHSSGIVRFDLDGIKILGADAIFLQLIGYHLN
jgi:hypothetical protein